MLGTSVLCYRAPMLAPVLAWALMHQKNGRIDRNKASFLYHTCKGAIRFMDGNSRSGDLEETQSCLAYIDGLPTA